MHSLREALRHSLQTQNSRQQLKELNQVVCLSLSITSR